MKFFKTIDCVNETSVSNLARTFTGTKKKQHII